jgi:hypothetical protein
MRARNRFLLPLSFLGFSSVPNRSRRFRATRSENVHPLSGPTFRWRLRRTKANGETLGLRARMH